MSKPFPFTELPVELQLQVVAHLSFEAVAYLRMTNKIYQYFIPKPSLPELLVVENTDWSTKRDLFMCCHCLRLRRSTKFSEKMVSRKRTRGRHGAALRFCIECGLTVPWKDPGARGYNRSSRVRIMGLEYQVCKNCGLFERFKKWRCATPWEYCPRGYEANRKRVDKSEDLAKWRVEYKRTEKEKELNPVKDYVDQFGGVIRKVWPGLEMHGLPPSCL
jgi:hypothetical protein